MKKYYLSLFGLAFPLLLNAQETTPSTGGNASGSGGSVSYSVGQVAYTTITGNSSNIIQGVQQPYEILVVTGIENTNGISLEYSVFPNPAKDYLILKIEGILKTQYVVTFYDINGRLLQSINVTSNETQIITSNLFPTTYFLKIIDNNKEIKTFKIIKNK